MPSLGVPPALSTTTGPSKLTLASMRSPPSNPPPLPAADATDALVTVGADCAGNVMSSLSSTTSDAVPDAVGCTVRDVPTS